MNLQQRVKRNFEKHFGRTPLKQRIDDIFNEALELHRFTDLRNLREELGDLIASAIMGCEECGWNHEDLVLETLGKIAKRAKQYASLGRKINVAILGSACDPVTLGHIQVAQYILQTSRVFDEVWLMPCYQHMYNKEMQAPEHRLAMCELATQQDGRIRVDDFEIRSKLRGETFNTVTRLLDEDRAKHQYDFSWVIGMDNANTTDQWVNFDQLEKMIRFVVVPRQGYQPEAKWFHQPPHIYLGDCEDPIMEVSSSQFKEWHRAQDPKARECVNPAVYDYIRSHNLYQ